MKKILLSLLLVASAFVSQSQVVVAGVSPANIQGSYDFGTQANCGAWPGETDDGTWGVLSNLDFNVSGTFIQAELMLIEDGTAGTNPQGNPISQEGCFPATNDLTGKIAVIWRNSCAFVDKVINAQDAGAVAVIILNRVDDGLSMLGNVTTGPLATIPAVILTNTVGNLLVNEMSNGPVEMFIGNKLGAYPNDLGTFPEDILIPPYAGASSVTFNGFDLAMQMYNYGSAVQAAATVKERLIRAEVDELAEQFSIYPDARSLTNNAFSVKDENISSTPRGIPQKHAQNKPPPVIELGASQENDALPPRPHLLDETKTATRKSSRRATGVSTSASEQNI